MKGKIAASVIAGTLGLAVTGAAALAAFQAPEPTSAASVVAPIAGTTAVDKDGGLGGKIKAILDRLVANGTITQTQEDAIIKALREDGDHNSGAELKRVLGDLMKLSMDYLGLPPGQVKQMLADGKSLGDIANATPGHSRDGLIRYLVDQVTAQVQKALAEGKITKQQAERIKSHLTEHVTKFVDHKYERKPNTVTPRSPKPSPKATPTATPKA